GMTAREDQAQPVVAHGGLLFGLILRLQQIRIRMPVFARALAADAIDGAVARGGDDPPDRASGQSGRRPALDGGGEGVLHRLFGVVDAAEHAHQRRDRAAIFLAEHTLDLRERKLGHASCQRKTSRMGRTSIGSVIARASLRAQPSAASRSGAWMIVKPPTCSLPSVYGPSVVSTSASLACRTVEVSAGKSAAAKTHAPAALISAFTAWTLRMMFSRNGGGGGSPSG